ncbi:MAG: thioredoxin-dependent thiol peroxidase [Rectinema sp.]|nr:thioredoxin-dependent thiol peroxidase [Rectinema sp.]
MAEPNDFLALCAIIDIIDDIEKREDAPMIKEGMRAPDFMLADEKGRMWTLADFAGKKFIMYFYPRDTTPGCTAEACAFRDRYGAFRERGIEVVGVSPDSQASHQKFKEKFSIPFILLSDPEKKVLAAYGAWGEKTMYGRKVMGVIRSTVVISEEGTIERVFPKVTPAQHPEEILSWIDNTGR